MSAFATVRDSLSEGFFMLWETLWALVLGFTLSGAVQAFVSRADMQKAMGDHRARTVVRTALFGAASSSCSYAASALAKSLVQRGADFTSAMIFMFASTNLVVELGIVLWLLIGWQFAAAEFVGGAIMIALFAAVAPHVFPAAQVAAARARLDRADPRHPGHDAGTVHHAHDAHDAGTVHDAHDADPPASAAPVLTMRQRMRNADGWADAAGYAVSDVTMLRRELLIGYLVAGLIAVAVPARVFSAIFLPGHGQLTDVENAVVGPFVAFISFVCSIGNVPLAAALYQGGVSFGGTIAFIFADLIALPLVVIYAKLYGRRLATRMFFTFWAVMSVAGLAVGLLFRAVGISFPVRTHQIAPTRFAWDYTAVLNIAFLALAAGTYWLYRTRGAGAGYAKDPVCGMQIERARPGATTSHEGHRLYFCSDRCRGKFDRSPAKYGVGQPVG